MSSSTSRSSSRHLSFSIVFVRITLLCLSFEFVGGYPRAWPPCGMTAFPNSHNLCSILCAHVGRKPNLDRTPYYVVLGHATVAALSRLLGIIVCTLLFTFEGFISFVDHLEIISVASLVRVMKLAQSSVCRPNLTVRS